VADARIRLVVNADDFGMTAAVSRGIITAHRTGVVTSTSLLGNCDDLPAAAALLAEAPALGVGVHLSLIDGHPVSEPATVRSLVEETGTFPTRAVDFLARWARGRIVIAELEREIDAQIARARAAGITPDHLDTHHHIGFLPAVGKTLEAAARRHGIPGVRTLIEKPTLSWITEPRRGLEAGLLAGLGWMTRRQMGTLRHGPRSWGFVESGQLDEVRILEIIGRLEPGVHELICHPGESDDAGSAALTGSRYHHHRAQELAALTSPRIRGTLERRGITLCRWSDLF
jgi:predicted glycoside hydrolase/deacetylase ChbG (UPF0249 family)